MRIIVVQLLVMMLTVMKAVAKYLIWVIMDVMFVRENVLMDVCRIVKHVVIKMKEHMLVGELV